MVATSSGCADIGGQRWIPYNKAASLGCNWLVPEQQDYAGQRGRCLADSLVRREPEADDTIAVEKFGAHLCRVAAADLSIARYRFAGPSVLAPRHWPGFDLVSSYSTGERVVIGHAGGG
jgi:hypothetical protein